MLNKLHYIKDMKIILTLNKPINGLWDGGPKQVFEFKEDALHKLSDEYVCFGSWDMNFWFNIKRGRSDKETIGRAVAWIKRQLRVPAEISILKE